VSDVTRVRTHTATEPPKLAALQALCEHKPELKLCSLDQTIDEALVEIDHLIAGGSAGECAHALTHTRAQMAKQWRSASRHSCVSVNASRRSFVLANARARMCVSVERYMHTFLSCE
jgi:hypothetical protein